MSVKAENIVKLAEMLGDVLSGNPDQANSLTRYSKTTSVVSRVYIEDSIVSEDIAAPLMSTLNQIYISYVLTALQLNNLISNYSVVRSALQRVATEGFVDVLEQVEECFGLDNAEVSTEAKAIELEKSVAHLAMGKVIEFDFIVGKDDKNKPITVTAPIHVSLIPSSVTDNVATAFLELNFTPTMSRRWKQVKAGEISLFRDFLLSGDLVKKYAKAIKEDKSNALAEMVSTKNKNRGRHIMSMLGKTNNNVASSVLIFDRRTFDRASIEAGLDFKTYNDRQKFFDTALAMMVVVVDPLYDNVDIYFNGLEQGMSMPSSMVEKAGGSSGVDMKEFMATLAKGAPKF